MSALNPLLFIAGQEYSTHLERLNGMADAARGSIVEHSTIKDTSTHLPSRPTPYELHGSWCPHAYSRTLKYTRLFYPSCSEIRKTEQWAVYSKTSSGCPEVVRMSGEVLTTV